MHETMTRLYEIALDQYKITGQSALARLLNASPQTVKNWETRGVSNEGMIAAEKIMGCSPLWIKTGEGERQSNSPRSDPKTNSARYIEDAGAAGFVPVRRVHIRLSAGVSGFSIEQDEVEGAPIFFRGDWLRLKGWNASQLIAVRVTGESMQPNLFDGDLVVVNTSDTQTKDGEVFAVNHEGELVIKRLRKESGVWWLDSDNPDRIRYRPRQCGDGCFILGRVVYKQSERI